MHVGLTKPVSEIAERQQALYFLIFGEIPQSF
jgi:hypothetical protein